MLNTRYHRCAAGMRARLPSLLLGAPAPSPETHGAGRAVLSCVSGYGRRCEMA
jgi:hypothetical protein